ncbi:globin domain-containing protein [Streptomyces lushanensis]|uniref:globin domain-containing protein n=1 Tax=Streptomyces lushanensis TaxID=1434255 RepID=UPI001FDEA89F|nr:globin domain-containing protein [Streptomyces lushanensis]
MDEVPDAFRPRAKGSRGGDGPAAHPPVPEGPVTTAETDRERGPVSQAAAEAAVRSAVGRPEPAPPIPAQPLPSESASAPSATAPTDPVGPPEARPQAVQETTGPPARPRQPEPDAQGRASEPEATDTRVPQPDAVETSRTETSRTEAGPAETGRTETGASELRTAGPLPQEVPVSAALPPEAPPAAPATQPSVAAPTPSLFPEDRNASPDAILIRRTLEEVAPVADQLTSYFYALLFVRHPDLRNLFPAAMDAQRDRLLKALLTAAEHMDTPDVLTGYLRQLGRGHRKYGTQPTHYPAVGEALIGALTRYGSAIWDEETEGAWVRTYTTISQIMIDAAAENELHAPAWWQAEVVSHELRTADIAVVTVRPDQPYPFLAGQYTSLETPWWPRVWRHYSFASAPRPDGLLSFHVKAVPAGWVSNALVHRAGPGDVLRLGPPAGSMIVDHSSHNGLLCLGGGTGIAPIKALVEDVAEHGHRRPVEVFYGARSDQDLYDIETMLRLESEHSWLSVRPVVAEGPSLGLTGQLPEAVREHGPWHEYDAYLSGPPGMIRSGLDALKGAGIPSERIRHDSLEELVAAAN